MLNSLVHRSPTTHNDGAPSIAMGVGQFRYTYVEKHQVLSALRDEVATLNYAWLNKVREHREATYAASTLAYKTAMKAFVRARMREEVVSLRAKLKANAWRWWEPRHRMELRAQLSYTRALWWYVRPYGITGKGDHTHDLIPRRHIQRLMQVMGYDWVWHHQVTDDMFPNPAQVAATRTLAPNCEYINTHGVRVDLNAWPAAPKSLLGQLLDADGEGNLLTRLVAAALAERNDAILQVPMRIMEQAYAMSDVIQALQAWKTFFETVDPTAPIITP